MGDNAKAVTVGDTGLTQVELGACGATWIVLFGFFSVVDVTGAALAPSLP